MPLLVRWRGTVPKGTICDETICHVDLMATLCAALRIELPAHAGPDSFNVLPAWLGESSARPLREATVCVGSNSLVYSIRQGSWKLLVTADGIYRGKDVPPQPKDTRRTLAEPELFNLTEDPREQHNLAAVRLDKFNELALLLARYRAEDHTRPGWMSP